MEKSPQNPKLVLLFSGKRKSGKDFICGKLQELLNEISTIVRISGPLKCLYAKKHNLDISELLSDSPYKEKFRLDMIKWSDEIRAKNKGYFCKAACDSAPEKPLWIISDARRRTDMEWFKENYKDKVKTVRIVCDLSTRKDRGWVFTPGVDDTVSECDLDQLENDLVVRNNNDKELDEGIKSILLLIKSF